MPRRGLPWRTSVAAGLAALLMLPSIAGCGGQPRAGPVATDSSIPAPSPISFSAAMSDISSGAAPPSPLVAASMTTDAAAAAAATVTPPAADPAAAVVALRAGLVGRCDR